MEDLICLLATVRTLKAQMFGHLSMGSCGPAQKNNNNNNNNNEKIKIITLTSILYYLAF